MMDFQLYNGILLLINNLPAEMKSEIMMKECVLESNNPTDSPPKDDYSIPESPINKGNNLSDILLEGPHLQDCRSPSFIYDLTDTANANASSLPNSESASFFNSPNPEEISFYALETSP